MALKEILTNEALKSLFKNNFELANYAIKLARYSIKHGQEVNADDLLDEIRKNPQRLKELQEIEAAEETPVVSINEPVVAPAADASGGGSNLASEEVDKW